MDKQLDDAQTVHDLIKFTEIEIAKQLQRTNETLAQYGLTVNYCDISTLDARTQGGGGEYLFDVRLNVVAQP